MIAFYQYRTITPFGPPMWQAEVDNVRCMSASPATAVGQKALHRAKRRYRTVLNFGYRQAFFLDIPKKTQGQKNSSRKKLKENFQKTQANNSKTQYFAN